MQTTSVKLYSLGYNETKTYLTAAIFVLGNIALPQLCHLIPQGGVTLLPIYFFTLIGAYKYGWRVGLLTALLSPLVNNLLFGMPALAVLPAILIKSTLLAFSASITAHYFKKTSVLTLILVVLSYQIIGTFAEWAITGSLMTALQDFRIGILGMVIQIFGGYIFINKLLLSNKKH